MFRRLSKGINFLFGKKLQREKIFITNSLEFLERKRNIDKNYFDYIRIATLELISFEINKKNLRGNVAELGVYKGKFARYINLYFKERNLYLFDTFEGFDKRDVNKEINEGFSSGSQDFTNTSVASVLRIMPFPEKCIPVQGFFPESAKNINERFVFISIDADLYEPVYEGLKFFYKNLVNGGYIFVHDFNNDHYKGARKAVERFCGEENICFTPIPDAAGTVVITK
ncbi:class I SAM-dependent methyltransferase [Ginsengibacter hankyongi]|uniref:Class I SAM-dependent methyltransferase n=1 Tax=Ginsengibacter hankyongi TaxID=2607284 RepID=A0A5J5IGF9_9BACT|nr:TylF/MycF/NovP-related O-methyltransferase [Ginsengibacter hankyongi]KAA9039245.1 class I SAM-dependent methyltransferase [Ginsengibacter hankyongi]